jgi:predicted HAD superfamily Cof-like phosphohydrolase
LAAQIAAKTKSHAPAARERIRAGEVDDWIIVQMAEVALEQDSGIEMVREFNKAFGCWTEEKPRLFFSNESGERYIEEWVERFEEGAAALKDAAARFNEEGQQTTGLVLVRMQLALEELAEQWRAFLDADVVKLFDALLDRQYVLDGDFHTFGLASIKLQGYRVVHGCNMAKLGPDGKPIIDSSGRVAKPEGWTGPDEELKALIEAASAPQQGEGA